MKYPKTVLIMCVSVVLLVAVLLATKIYKDQNTVLNSSLSNQISFIVFWPKSKDIIPEKNTIKYDKTAGVISYIAVVYGVHTTVTEQAVPSQFIDFSNYYSSFVAKLNNYDTFSSLNGNVYLTVPPGTSGNTAVLDHSGTLLFAHAEKRLSENDWRTLFNNLTVIHT